MNRTQISETSKKFMLNVDIGGCVGVYSDRVEIENDIFHDILLWVGKSMHNVHNLYRNNPSSKYREIGQSDDITGFQLMHPFSGKHLKPKGVFLGLLSTSPIHWGRGNNIRGTH